MFPCPISGGGNIECMIFVRVFEVFWHYFLYFPPEIGCASPGGPPPLGGPTHPGHRIRGRLIHLCRRPPQAPPFECENMYPAAGRTQPPIRLVHVPAYQPNRWLGLLSSQRLLLMSLSSLLYARTPSQRMRSIDRSYTFSTQVTCTQSTFVSGRAVIGSLQVRQ